LCAGFDEEMSNEAKMEPVLKRALYGRKCKPIGAPRRYSLYDLYRAMLSVLVNGIRWRDLPRDFRRWQALGVLGHGVAAPVRCGGSGSVCWGTASPYPYDIGGAALCVDTTSDAAS
jgi:hypothetical protein